MSWCPLWEGGDGVSFSGCVWLGSVFGPGLFIFLASPGYLGILVDATRD